ncbi:MAG: hypothetical protein D6706_17665 [Chloroflexi bacterium]|nr:MAG: hypothetical protein D6706_17665 [Chloroflexota bacterium]
MGIPFGTDEWIQALHNELNNSDAYRKAAEKWEGDFYFVVDNGDGNPTYLYLDLWHGQSREACFVQDPSEKSPEFILSGPLDTWRKIVEKKLDPIRALMTRQLKLKGNMMKIMKVPKAATELVECCTRIDTEWPE